MRGLRPIGAIVLVALILVLGVVGMAQVPARKGRARGVVLKGEQARAYVAQTLAAKPQVAAARREAERLLESRGLTKSSTVVLRHYHEPVDQTAMRELAEWLVPSLHAQEISSDDGDVTIDDWSGYDATFNGVFTVSTPDNAWAVFDTSFLKDPDQMVNSMYVHLVAQDNGDWVPPMTRNDGVFSPIIEKLLPTVHAFRWKWTGWAGRMRAWGECVLGGCATAASACFIANVMDAEVLWTPCAISWCGGSEVGCTVVNLMVPD